MLKMIRARKLRRTALRQLEKRDGTRKRRRNPKLFPVNPLPVRFLSIPDKMPGRAWSLPAGKTCPASKITLKLYGANATCASCYAMGGHSTREVVARAKETRLQFVLDSLRNDNGDRFVKAMVEHITWAVSNGDPYFRIHESGDFFSPAYVEAWIRVCEALPSVHFWAPTREWLRPVMLPSLHRLAALPNVTVRPSGAKNNELPPIVSGFAAGTAVYDRLEDVPKGVMVCPASATDKHACDDHGCRSCWDSPEVAKVYIWHGSAIDRLIHRAQLRTELVQLTRKPA